MTGFVGEKLPFSVATGRGQCRITTQVLRLICLTELNLNVYQKIDNNWIKEWNVLK